MWSLNDKMFISTMHLLLILSLIPKITAIWPPEYKVNLKYEEEFVISDPLDKADVQDIYDEEEAIRQEDMKTLKLYENNKKYFGLHRMANLRNARGSKRKDENLYFKRIDEFNPDLEESQPWIGGFVDQNNNILKNEDTIYFDDEAKNEKIEKREAENDTNDYNYENLKAQYDDSVNKNKQNNDTAKYKEIKEEESAAEAVKTLVEFKAKNCTEEEKSGLGIVAIKCFWLDSKKKHMNKDQKFFMLKKVLLIIIIWILVYACIALPLWCQYGWCCCCFRCKFCNPRDQIDEIKKFYLTNPPGVLQDEDGNLKKYKSTIYETYAHRNLEGAIRTL